MKTKLIISISIIILIGCKKKTEIGSFNLGNYTDTAGTLKEAAAFPIGMAIDYDLFKNNVAYRNTIAREADQVTFGYHMKHGAIVKDDGSFDFGRADELM